METNNMFAGFVPKNVGEEVLKLMRTSFDMSISNAVRIQEINEKVYRDMFELGKSIQGEGVRFVDELFANVKKGREEYQKVVAEGFKKAEEMLVQ